MNFQPLPWLSNPHLQTILGNYLTGVRGTLPSQPHLVALPDGDRIVLHETPPSRIGSAERMALLVHGLGGNSSSAYMVRIARRLAAEGWRVLRMDLRGAGAGQALARRFYCAASSPDIGTAVDYLAQAFPGVPLAVVGFSLGGNIVLKYAGEPGAKARVFAAIAPPIDLLRCSEQIARYPLYDAFLVRHLVQQVRRHQQLFPDLPAVEFPRRLTLWQFDELYTAPRWGYPSVTAYYRDASSAPRIHAIRQPTFILTARDDPFVAIAPFEELSAPAGVEVHIAEHGGHLGFLGRDKAGGIRWGETQLIQWLTQRMGEGIDRVGT